MEQLQNKLHSYSLFGLPKVPRQLSFHQDSWEEGQGETNLAMEDSWQMLLDDPQVPTQRDGGSERLSDSRTLSLKSLCMKGLKSRSSTAAIMLNQN